MTGVRHVWVRLAFVPVELPGLVLHWRSTERGWEGLVSYVDREGRAVTEWLAATSLRPIGPEQQAASPGR
ncbi:hypothetical protein [Nocardioides nitrophenolicus]|uniref:hypothetical protein n=1 Tax=Nocardioides nitrophenolicus TaxID=60489 RepID=UPI00195AB3EA|nr:hypothetical protein [Nocardioides nitrophenolicus]MBM7520146.1 hypothetical protein [Nocardioides nitrophenolicus]